MSDGRREIDLPIGAGLSENEGAAGPDHGLLGTFRGHGDHLVAFRDEQVSRLRQICPVQEEVQVIVLAQGRLLVKERSQGRTFERNYADTICEEEIQDGDENFRHAFMSCGLRRIDAFEVLQHFARDSGSIAQVPGGAGEPSGAASLHP